jgi:cell division protein FtsB
MEICVFSTANQIEADMVKNALDENKIDNYLKNKSANTLGLGGWTVGVGGANLAFGDIKVMVKENDKEKALEIVKLLFGDEENDDATEFEETEISSNGSENLNETQENYDTEKTIEEGINNNNNKTTIKGKKKSPKRNFLIFLGLIFLVMIAFSVYINMPSKQKKDKIETVIQYYYYEMFTIQKDEYNSIFQPSEWDLDSTKDYRKRLKSHNPKLLYSTADATENDLFTIFTNSGYTPSETNDIIYDINLIGNMLFSVEYEKDENYVQITYFEKL